MKHGDVNSVLLVFPENLDDVTCDFAVVMVRILVLVNQLVHLVRKNYRINQLITLIGF